MTLAVTLDREPPSEIPAGTDTAAFVVGACVHSARPVSRLEILVGGASQPVDAFGMPRPDLRATRPLGPELSERAAREGGFWAIVSIPAARISAGSELPVTLRATLDDRGVETAGLGVIRAVRRPVAPAPSAAPERAGGATIAICMATFEPDMRLFSVQVESLRRQRDRDWICLISDDHSSAERYAAIERLIGDDARFALSRSASRLGFYRNFERALRMVPDAVSLVALCDQDDDWHPDKLQELRAALDGAVLAYSDLRLVEADGRVLRETLWKGRANNHSSLTSMLVANTITGAAMLFRRELLELALPFPDTPGMQFHDTWLAVIGLAAGSVAYVDRPLYDYVQHPGAVFGDVTHGARRRADGPRAALRALPVSPRALRASPRALRASLRSGAGWRSWRAAYFYGYVPRALQARLALARGGDRITPAKRRELQSFASAELSPAELARLAVRPARALAGHTETLGNEWVIARGLLWRALATALCRGRLPAPACLNDASTPPLQAYSERRLRRWRASL